MDKNIKNAPRWGFYPICDSQVFFFKNRDLSLLYPYRAPHHAKQDKVFNGPRV